MASGLFKWDTGQDVDKTAIHKNVDSEIFGLTDKATPANSDVLVIEDSAASYAKKKLSWTNIKAALKAYFDTLYKPVDQGWIYANDPRWVGTQYAPLTSTSWDGDSYSTTAKTLIDLSAVFGIPAGVKAVLIQVTIRDSGSAAGDTWTLWSPNNTANSGIGWDCTGITNDAWDRSPSFIVPCDANGDIYFQIAASGASTMDIYLNIWGYYL